MDSSLLKLASESVQRYNSEFISAISEKDGSILAWFNNQMYHSAALALNLVHNAIIGDKYSIDVTNAPLKFAAENKTTPDDNFNDGDVLGYTLAFMIGIAMSMYSASFIMFYVKVIHPIDF